MQINLLDDEKWAEPSWPPEKAGYRWRRKRVAGEHLGASIAEEHRWFRLDQSADHRDGEADR